MFQRKLVAAPAQYAETEQQQDRRWLDRRTGEKFDLWEFFDRHATCLAVCIEFGV